MAAVAQTLSPEGPESLRERCLGFGWGPAASPPLSQQPAPAPSSLVHPDVVAKPRTLAWGCGGAGRQGLLPGPRSFLEPSPRLLGPVGRGHGVIAPPGP